MSYLRQISFQAQIGDQLPCMIIQIAHSVAVSASIVAPTQDTCVGNIAREEVARPMYAVARCPCLLAVTVQPVDDDDAAPSQRPFFRPI